MEIQINKPIIANEEMERIYSLMQRIAKYKILWLVRNLEKEMDKSSGKIIFNMESNTLEIRNVEKELKDKIYNSIMPLDLSN